MPAGLRTLLRRLLWALPLCYLLWAMLSPALVALLAVPANWLGELLAPSAVQYVSARASALEVGIHVDNLPVEGGVSSATVVHSVDGQLYTHGMAFFFALLIAANGMKWRRSHILGLLLLWLSELLSLTIHIIWLGVFAHPAPGQGMPAYLAEALVVADHIGGLVLPTLAPVMIWLWLDRRLVMQPV